MKTFAKVTGEDLAFFESILPGRVFSSGNVSSDYEHDEMTIYGLYAPEAVLLHRTRMKSAPCFATAVKRG